MVHGWGAAEIISESVHCVAATNKIYSITVTGSGAAGAFVVSSGPADIPFQVWYKESRQGNLVQLSTGTAIHNLTGKAMGRKLPFCRSGTATIEVRIQGSDLASAPAGSYFGTLTMMVVPQ